MKPSSTDLFCCLIVSAFPIFSFAHEPGQPATETLYTSLSGALRIESVAETPSNGGEPASTVWVVSTKDPGQRAKIPKESSDPILDDDEFNCSPNDEWIFGSRHAGSGLRDGTLYHRLTPQTIELVKTGKPFNQAVWANSVKLGAQKRDYCDEGFYAITRFVGWSLDSSRVVIELTGGEEKRDMRSGLLYFNTRTNRFELTDYLRSMNKSKSDALVCAEPTDALPNEDELKTRYEKLDQQLNKTYAAVIAGTRKESVSNVRENQREWIRHRDEGAKIYPSFFPQPEHERRRLQFLGDVTATRVEDLPVIQQEYS